MFIPDIQLAKKHPQEEIRLPPAKDKTYSAAPSITPTTSHPPMSPLSRQSTSSTFNDYNLNSPTGSHSENLPSNPSRLTREKNRLTLRSYLNTLMNSSTIASSPVLRSFLLSGPTTMTSEELEDAKRREEADRVREEGRKKFAKEIAGRVEGLREAVKSVKGDIMGKGNYPYVYYNGPPHILFRWLDSYFCNHQSYTRYQRSALKLPCRCGMGEDIVSANSASTGIALYTHHKIDQSSIHCIPDVYRLR